MIPGRTLAPSLALLESVIDVRGDDVEAALTALLAAELVYERDAGGMARDLAGARRLFAEMDVTGWDAAVIPLQQRRVDRLKAPDEMGIPFADRPHVPLRGRRVEDRPGQRMRSSGFMRDRLARSDARIFFM